MIVLASHAGVPGVTTGTLKSLWLDLSIGVAELPSSLKWMANPRQNPAGFEATTVQLIQATRLQMMIPSPTGKESKTSNVRAGGGQLDV